MEKLNGFGSSP